MGKQVFLELTTEENLRKLNIDPRLVDSFKRVMTKVQQYFDSYGYSDKNNILLNVDERFGERRFGVNNMSELPKIFFEDQFRDCNFILAKKWCDIQVVDDKLKYSFNNDILLNGYFNYCETFKLEFDDNYELISIQNINLD